MSDPAFANGAIHQCLQSLTDLAAALSGLHERRHHHHLTIEGIPRVCLSWPHPGTQPRPVVGAARVGVDELGDEQQR
jgi:hypothetical protein